MEPTRFGHYELRELIGRGGMGEVYVAYDTNTQRTVALVCIWSACASETGPRASPRTWPVTRRAARQLRAEFSL